MSHAGSGEHVHPTYDDPVVASLSDAVGGPRGEHAGPSRWWTPVRVVLALTAVCFAVGLLQKGPCAEQEWQNGNGRYAYLCASPVADSYLGSGLVERTGPYATDAGTRFEVFEEPPGTAYWAWGAGLATHAVHGFPDLSDRFRLPVGVLEQNAEVRDEVVDFVALNAVGLALAALLTAWLLTRVHRSRPWDAAIFAASPLLALSGVAGWELLGAMLTAGALWAWSTDRRLLAGTLIGAGAATSGFPALLALALLVLCLRERRLLDGLGMVASTVGAWVLINAPAYVLDAELWRQGWSTVVGSGAGAGSIWTVIEGAADVDLASGTVTAWSLTALGVWCAAVLALGLAAPLAPRPAQLGFLLVTGALLIATSFGPASALLLLPLAALARPRWRDQLVWQSGEVLAVVMAWWFLGGYLTPGGGGDPGFYWLAIMVRMAAELYLVAVVVRDVWWPEEDPVRELGRIGESFRDDVEKQGSAPSLG